MTFRRLPFLGLLVATMFCAFIVGRATSTSSLAAAASPPAGAPANSSLQGLQGQGLVVVQSNFSAEETAERLTMAVSAGAASVVADIDHAAAAAAVGLELRPTRVLLVGNPLAGTPLMVASQTAGIDLPLKFLIYEDAEGRVLLAYNSTRYLKRRHHIRGEDQLLDNIEANLRALAEVATQG